MENTVDHLTPPSPRARSALARYMAEIGAYPLLSREEEAAVARQGRDALVLSNLRFVVKIAAGYCGRGLSLEDLINEGNLGLIQAAQRFDPARGVKFITYAAYWIRKALCQALSQQSSPVRLPRYQLLKSRRRKEEKGPDKGIDRPPLVVTSLDEPASPGGEGTQADFLSDDSVEDPEEAAVRLDLLSKVGALLDLLDEREKAVIVGRFGLSGSEGRTLKQVGEAFGLSRERIRQIEREVRWKLRDRLESAPRRRPDRKRGDIRKKPCNPFAGRGS